MSKMVEVVIDSVRVSLTNQQRIVVLREPNVERYLPIFIGSYEAEAITIALQEVEVARPQTHDLLKSVIYELNARLLRVEIVALREDVFYGILVVETSARTVEIDCRPSDALALAVRAHVSILVTREVLDSAGITPEEEGAVKETPAVEEKDQPEAGTAGPGEASEERLSVFEDFLQNLDLGKPKPPDEPEGDEDTDVDDKPKKKK
jgi:bifunctional DNase/RNase